MTEDGWFNSYGTSVWGVLGSTGRRRAVL